MFRILGYHPSRSQRSIQSTLSRTSAYSQSTSASSLPVTLSRSASLSSRRKFSASKYQNFVLFLFALILFSLAPTLRLMAQTHAHSARFTTLDSDTLTSSQHRSSASTNEFNNHGISTISSLSVHRISEVLFDMVHNEELTSLAVYPCHKHLPILRSLSQLLSLETSQQRSLIFCLDSSSARLAEAHSAIREEGYAFDIKFMREDLTKKPLPKASVFVRIDDDILDAASLTGFLMSVKGSGAQVAVVNAILNKSAKWDVTGDYESAPLPLAEHIQLIKPLENGFVAVYDLFNLTQ